MKSETLLKRYLAYWEKHPDLGRHEVDCPNPDCDERLNIPKPPVGSGDKWDSLAQCPYCNGMFFYVSRPRRVELAYKGKMGAA